MKDLLNRIKEQWGRFKTSYKENRALFYKTLVSFVLVIFAIISIIGAYVSGKNAVSAEIKTVNYKEFLKYVDEGKVDTVYYSTSDEWMTFTLFTKKSKKLSLKERQTYKYEAKNKRKVQYPAYDEFRKDMLNKNVNLKLSKKSNATDVLSFLVTLGLPILWIVVIFKVMSSAGKGLDADSLVQTSDVTFDNVIGQDEIIDDVKFITKLIKNKDLGEEIGAKIPKGILLSGEPGTGKTLIAKAIAGEADVPFLYVNSSSLIELFVGVGAKRVRDVFKIAREKAPCVLFFDEIDSIGIKRDSNKGSSENEQTINALLQEMDGFSGRDGVFIIAATNRADKLDEALTRAGRFDRQIVVNKPRDWKVRKELFNHYLSNFTVGDDVDTEVLAKQLSGFTGADIAAICNEASIIAVMHDLKYITMDCLEEAVDKKVFKGNRTKEEHFVEDKKVVAYHESGHAVVRYLFNLPIARASIIGTTSGVGGAVFEAESDSLFLTDDELKHDIMVAYGGRASEEIKFSSVTTGASNDLTQATQMISGYIMRYGFNKNFGLLDMSLLQQVGVASSEKLVNMMSEMSRELYNQTVTLLRDNYDKVELLAQKLLECETLSGAEINNLLKSEV